MLKKVSGTGGKEMARTVKKMMSTIMVGTGIKKVLIATVFGCLQETVLETTG